MKRALMSAAAALLAVVGFNSFVAQAFIIPSSSMAPTLLPGDYIIASKFAYGFSQYSLPFSLIPFSGRLFERMPERGDVAIFRLPRNPRQDYAKRIVGLPDDRVQVRGGILLLNGQRATRDLVGPFVLTEGRPNISARHFRETFPSPNRAIPGHTHSILEISDRHPFDNTPEFVVPKGHVFVLGDNRDDSLDSRSRVSVGFIPLENLVGRAEMVVLSVNGSARLWEVWKWPAAIRWTRLMQRSD